MVKTRKASQFCAVALSAACVATLSQVKAEETVPEGRRHFTWKGTTTSLVDPANWMTDKIWNDALAVEHDWDPKWESYPDGKVYENLLPTASDSVEATSMREAVLGEGDSFHVRDMSIDADGAVAKLTIDKGTFTADGEVVAGQLNRTSEVTLKDGSFSVGNLVLGHWGNAARGDPAHGILKVEGGTVTTTGEDWTGSLTLGRQDVGAKGEVLVSGGTVNVAGGRLSVGFSELTEKIRAASSRVVVSGGVVRVRDELDVGSADKSGGFLEVSGGEVSVGSSLRVGQGEGSVGFVELTGGAVTSGAELRVGAGEGAKAEVLIAGGTLTVAPDKDAVIGAAKNVDAHVKVTGGTLASSDSWFCIGRTTWNDEDNDPASNAAVSVLEIDGGTVSHQIASTPEDKYPWRHTTIGTFGSSATRSELVLKSGAFTTNHRIFIGEKNPGTLTVSGGTLTAEQIECMSEHGSYRFSGGTFRAAANVWGYFTGDGFGDVITLEGEGIAVAANGFEMVFTKKFAGKVSVVPGDGIVKFVAEDNAACVVAPVVTAPGLVTITAELNSATKADRTADGRYTLVWEDMGDNVYEVTATYDPVKTATWTNATGDGDVLNRANWSSVTVSGLAVAALPDATSAVLLPADLQRPDLTGLTYGSLALAVAPGATSTIERTCAVPDVLREAIAWYDPDDADALTVESETGKVLAMKNKGSAGSTLDLEPYTPSATDYLSPGNLFVEASHQLNRRTTIVCKNEAGLKSVGGVNVTNKENITMFAVSERRTDIVEDCEKQELFVIELCQGDEWNYSGYIGIAQWPDWAGSAHLGLDTAELDEKGNPHTDMALGQLANAQNVPYLWNFAVGANAAGGSVFWKGESGFDQLVSEGISYPAGRTFSNRPDGLSFVALGHRLENPNASQGLIGETVIFDRALTPDETAAVNAYLKTKWFQTFDASTLPAALELGAAATLDLQGEAVTFGTIAGAGTIANGDVTVTGQLGLGLTVSAGSLSFGDSATIDLASVATQPIGTVVTLLTAKVVGTEPPFVNADAGARKVKIAAVADENGVTTYIGTVVGKGLAITVR